MNEPAKQPKRFNDFELEKAYVPLPSVAETGPASWTVREQLLKLLVW